MLQIGIIKLYKLKRKEIIIIIIIIMIILINNRANKILMRMFQKFNAINVMEFLRLSYKIYMEKNKEILIKNVIFLLTVSIVGF